MFSLNAIKLSIKFIEYLRKTRNERNLKLFQDSLYTKRMSNINTIISIRFHIQAHDSPCGRCIFPVSSAKRFLHGVLYIDVKYYGK